MAEPAAGDTLASGHCDECGFDYMSVDRATVPGALRDLAPAYRRRLRAAAPDRLRLRPRPATWSALEYACHYRDVLRTQRARIPAALAEDRPVFEPMRRDERVTEDRYNAQDPGRVGRELAAATDELATYLSGLDDRAWSRTGIYLWPVRAERSVAWIGRHTVHEGVHHLLDVDRSLAEAQPGGR
ncbi:MAG: DinB family protein [Acidimicrobiales bacterium]